jgi:hypothetical protein
MMVDIDWRVFRRFILLFLIGVPAARVDDGLAAIMTQCSIGVDWPFGGEPFRPSGRLNR